MKFFDAFSGYGGFHLGIERAYENKSRLRSQPDAEQLRGDMSDTQGGRGGQCATCIGYSEIDKYASAVYKYHFGGRNEVWNGLSNMQRNISDSIGGEFREKSSGRIQGEDTLCNSQPRGQYAKNYGDITKIKADELPDFDLFTGGFPCQAFSIAGKRLGFAETRGTLIYEVFRILKEKQPRFVLLENVKGLLSHDSGRTFKTIISSLAELGYSVEWQVLNAKNFGVPQNRERVFIIGHLGGFGGRQVFPIRGDNEETKNTTHPTIDANYYKGHSNQRRVMAVPVLTPDRPEKRQNGRRFKENGDPSFTLTGQDKHGVYDGMKIRRLTPTECERLMGLPDDWTSKGDFDGEIKEISDTQRYKLCGNGVVVNVVEYIIDKLFRIKK
jgi:DNA (cytosine-5)-methyltransferase 1